MKKFYVFVALVGIISSLLTVMVIKVYMNNEDAINEFTDSIVNEVNSHSISNLDEEARNCGFTGIGSVSFGSLELNRCYINGEHVSAEEYQNYMNEQLTLHEVLFDEAAALIEEQDSRLNNITLRDWINCKFN